MNEHVLVQAVSFSFHRQAYFFVKRSVDLFFGIIGMTFLLPIAIMVKIICLLSGDFKPILFKQKRLGKNGTDLYIYKFRTMVPNAEKILQQWILDDNNYAKEYMKDRKISNDPRITKVGTFLRKTSLDEFPQFINIFKGDMSLIGPRPVVPDEIENYKDEKDKFLSMRPGLTGYWAVNGRSCTSYKERIKLELYYIDSCSIWLDIRIVWSTITTVIKREGAK